MRCPRWGGYIEGTSAIRPNVVEDSRTTPSYGYFGIKQRVTCTPISSGLSFHTLPQTGTHAPNCGLYLLCRVHLLGARFEGWVSHPRVVMTSAIDCTGCETSGWPTNVAVSPENQPRGGKCIRQCESRPGETAARSQIDRLHDTVCNQQRSAGIESNCICPNGDLLTRAALCNQLQSTAEPTAEPPRKSRGYLCLSSILLSG